ncbi:MAG: hypothetical protein QCI38_06765 [Candidatus Thermoplasmatota archaeon]|nr:hypothetical protein [Candidatus Thermoplasmatota archaeon]
MGKHWLPSLLLTVMVLLASFSISSLTSEAALEELEIYDYAKTPYLDKEYVQLLPGESTRNSMLFVNRYSFPMENVSIELEVYRFRTYRDSKPISDISSPPTISGQGLILYQSMDFVQEGEGIPVNHTIRTSSSTPLGLYLIRFKLEFDVNGTRYLMMSRGHFNDQIWSEALENRSVTKFVAGQNVSTGGIDLDVLGVDGIVEDTSITVAEPFPLWPFFVLASIAAFFGIGAVVFYLQEEKNMFPKAEWAYQRAKGKARDMKSRVEALLKRRSE